MRLIIEIKEIDYNKTAGTWLLSQKEKGGLRGIFSEKLLLGITKLPQRKKDAATVWFLNQMEELLLSLLTEAAAKQGVYLKLTSLQVECDSLRKEKTETS
ncbi:MAG: hypothetical protein IKY28_04350 [Anaerotignum sp.]|nr:hypothetical protein [Anaerotignum sp.]